MFSDPTEFPPEIQTLILNQLSPESLREALTVSRRWHESIVHLSAYLRRPIIYGDSATKFLQAFYKEYTPATAKHLEVLECSSGLLKDNALSGFTVDHLQMQYFPDEIVDVHLHVKSVDLTWISFLGKESLFTLCPRLEKLRMEFRRDLSESVVGQDFPQFTSLELKGPYEHGIHQHSNSNHKLVTAFLAENSFPVLRRLKMEGCPVDSKVWSSDMVCNLRSLSLENLKEYGRNYSTSMLDQLNDRGVHLDRLVLGYHDYVMISQRGRLPPRVFSQMTMLNAPDVYHLFSSLARLKANIQQLFSSEGVDSANYADFVRFVTKSTDLRYLTFARRNSGWNECHVDGELLGKALHRCGRDKQLITLDLRKASISPDGLEKLLSTELTLDRILIGEGITPTFIEYLNSAGEM